MSTQGVPLDTIPQPTSQYDRINEAAFRRAMQISLQRLNSRLQTVGIGDDETLLDPDADETISGDWTFSGSPTLPESSITAHEGALSISESQITDGSLLARLADNETVSGTWTFSGTPVVIGADTGDGDLRVTGDAMFRRAGSGDGTYGATIGVGQGASLDNMPSIRSVQEGGDADRQGLAFFTKDSATFSDPATERFRIKNDGNVVVGSPSSGGVVNVVHHGTGSPSSVGVEGTLHTQDA